MSISYGGDNITFPDASTQNTSPKTGFLPTALIVFTHQKTGLKYFAKTTRIHEMHLYKGSGLHWKRHLKMHGRSVDASVLGFYFKEEACVKAALDFSEKNNIKESDEWANLVLENGLDGGASGVGSYWYGKPSHSLGAKRPWVGKSGAENPMYGKPSAMRGKQNLGASKALKGRPRPEGGGKKPNAVIRLDDGKWYASVADAAKELGKTRRGITQCCMGTAKTAHGYRWKYADAKLEQSCQQ